MAVQSGWQCRCIPELQFRVPTASNPRNSLELSSIQYTRPSLTTGVEPLPVNAFHSGAQTFGTPEQFVRLAVS